MRNEERRSKKIENLNGRIVSFDKLGVSRIGNSVS
jgi:hypothetical protein